MLTIYSHEKEKILLVFKVKGLSLQYMILNSNNMNTLTIRDERADRKIIDAYWNMLRSLSNDMKLKLATRLTASVVEKAERTETSVSEHTRQMLDKFYGAWEGDESAEQIIATMKENSSIRQPLEF